MINPPAMTAAADHFIHDTTSPFREGVELNDSEMLFQTEGGGSTDAVDILSTKFLGSLLFNSRAILSQMEAGGGISA